MRPGDYKAMSAIQDFFDRDIDAGHIVPVDCKRVKRLERLTAGVEVDLGAEFDPNDD